MVQQVMNDYHLEPQNYEHYFEGGLIHKRDVVGWCNYIVHQGALDKEGCDRHRCLERKCLRYIPKIKESKIYSNQYKINGTRFHYICVLAHWYRLPIYIVSVKANTNPIQVIYASDADYDDSNDYQYFVYDYSMETTESIEMIRYVDDHGRYITIKDAIARKANLT